MIWTSYYGYIEVVKFLVEKGADIEAKNYDGNGPLVWASLSGSLKVVKFLLENGSDIEAKNNEGNTPLLFLASNYGYIEVIKFLVEKRS